MPIKTKYGWVNNIQEYREIRKHLKYDSAVLRMYQNAEVMLPYCNAVVFSGIKNLFRVGMLDSEINRQDDSEIIDVFKQVKEVVDNSNNTIIAFIDLDTPIKSSSITRAQCNTLIKINEQHELSKVSGNKQDITN